jgi:hypothetical protein
MNLVKRLVLKRLIKEHFPESKIIRFDKRELNSSSKKYRVFISEHGFVDFYFKKMEIETNSSKNYSEIKKISYDYLKIFGPHPRNYFHFKEDDSD